MSDQHILCMPHIHKFLATSAGSKTELFMFQDEYDKELTLKAPFTTAADGSFFFLLFFFIFQRKQVLTFHVNHVLGR